MALVAAARGGRAADPAGREAVRRGKEAGGAEALRGRSGPADAEEIAGLLSLFAVRCVFHETCQCLAKIYLPPTLTG